MPCTRIVLLNTTKSPSRQELTTSERCIGDVFLAPLELEFGGYELVVGTGKKAARWMVPEEKWNQALDFVESYDLEGYQIMLFAQVDSKAGTHSRRFA